MRLVLTEKPSVARDLARVLGARSKQDGWIEGDGVRITWCRGHLLELQDPVHYDPAWKRWRLDTLPMVPERFALRVRKGASAQWKVVRRLLRAREISEVVNACDAGREGELIFRYAYQHAGCTRPVSRLWVSSMTSQALRAALDHLRPGEGYDALAAAARCRSEADWLVGLNATRALTCVARGSGSRTLWSVGRVQTPTLAMIVARDLAIEAFVSEPFWRVRATFESRGARWEGTWYREKGEQRAPSQGERGGAPRAERIADEQTARAIAAAVRGRRGLVEKSSRRRRVERPPLLYDLTSLQRRANQRYGLSAQRTLSAAQVLYEKHKLITYPRTDARYLTPDQVPGLSKVVKALGAVKTYAPFVAAVLSRPIRPTRRVVDASEVGDHHAIVPTGRTPRTENLAPDEKRVFDLVARRYLAALSPDAVLALAEIVVAVDPGGKLPFGASVPLRFRARGRVVLEPGWRRVDPPPKRADKDLPEVAQGADARVLGTEVLQGKTTPPKPMDDASILRGMETAGRELEEDELARALRNAGLGTPATRAAILQTLLDRDYVVREGKALRATERGRALVDALPVDELKSAELTARWEARLAAMAEGRESREAFMADVAAHTGRIVEAISAASPPAFHEAPVEAPVLGSCPVCKTPVREGRAAYTCETGRACPFVVHKKMARRKISARMVRVLLAKGRTRAVKGFRSKKGRKFSAGLEVSEEGEVRFWFPERRKGGASGQPMPPGGAKPEAPELVLVPPDAHPVGMPCPRCGRGRIIAGRTAWGCDQWRQGCELRVPYQLDGRAVSAREAVELLRRAR